MAGSLVEEALDLAPQEVRWDFEQPIDDFMN
jgi:hypothetical protein